MQLGFRPSKGLTFTVLTLLQIFGLYIFLKGFLLTRQTFDLQGKRFEPWQDFPLTQYEQEKKGDALAKKPTTIPSQKAFSRTIIVLIDALRFDFAINAPSSSSTATSEYYLNQFPVMQKLAQQQPASSLLYQFRADPPTTTMQRIKGLMTGSLPTFIDAGSNFASSAVNEDHLLRHLVNKTMYFLGDDTWVHLFPESFAKERTFDSDSFKMLDLDSVDDAILSRLWGVLDKEDWQVTIAHFLGVDHCGHTYGPSDPNMKRKLNQMNGIVERLVSDYVDEDTLLVVMGDHGMSVEGDHGGESVEELISTLFMHSGRPLTFTDEYYQALYSRIHKARALRLGYDIVSISQRLKYDATAYPVVAQIHLVPSLAYLLDIPIPFGNLGAILPDILMPQHVDTHSKMRNVLHMAQEFRTNALQVKLYLDKYAQQTHQLDFSPEKLQLITRHLYAAEEIMAHVMKEPDFSSSIQKDHTIYLEQLEEAILEYDAFLISTIKYCKAIWAQFDTGCMFVGIVLLGFSTCASLWLMHREPRASYRRVSIVGVSVFAMCLAVSCLRYPFSEVLVAGGWFEKMEHMDWIGTCLAVAVCCVALTLRPQGAASFDWYVILVAQIAQACTLGSNSFVIWEDRATRYVLATLTMVWMVRNLQAAFTKTDRALALLYPTLLLAVLRLTSAIGQCREEQFPHCSYFHSGMLEFNLENYTGYGTIAFVVVLYGMVIFTTTTLNQVSGLTIGACYIIPSIMVLFRIFYEIGAKSLKVEQGQNEMPLMVHRVLDVYMPRIVYALTFIGNNMTLADWYFNSRPRRAMSWALFFLWTPLLAIVQRPLGAALILVSPWIVKLLTTGKSNSLLVRLTMLHFLGHHLFFATGYQATFTSLPWKAAFVGFDDMNYYGGMILVTLATVSGYIITWFGWLVMLSENPHQRQTLHLLILLQSIPTFLSAIFIFVLRRHLMTWKIFAPRFLFQILLQVGSHVAAIILERIVE
ncbi:mannose-ethanolamine phosphotransferase gpi13 [Mucor circinelloides]